MNQFMDMMEDRTLKEIQLYYNTHLDEIFDSHTLFSIACMNGRIDVAKWALSINPGIDLVLFSESNEFKKLCYDAASCSYMKKNNLLELIQWLLRQNIFMDTSFIDREYFLRACQCGNLDFAKWFMQMNPDFDVCFNENEAFEEAYHSGNFELVKWLFEMI